MKPEDTPVDMSHYHRDRWDGDIDLTTAELCFEAAKVLTVIVVVCAGLIWAFAS